MDVHCLYSNSTVNYHFLVDPNYTSKTVSEAKKHSYIKLRISVTSTCVWLTLSHTGRKFFVEFTSLTPEAFLCTRHMRSIKSQRRFSLSYCTCENSESCIRQQPKVPHQPRFQYRSLLVRWYITPCTRSPRMELCHPDIKSWLYLATDLQNWGSFLSNFLDEL